MHMPLLLNWKGNIVIWNSNRYRSFFAITYWYIKLFRLFLEKRWDTTESWYQSKLNEQLLFSLDNTLSALCVCGYRKTSNGMPVLCARIWILVWLGVCCNPLGVEAVTFEPRRGCDMQKKLTVFYILRSITLNFAEKKPKKCLFKNIESVYKSMFLTKRVCC